MANLTDSFDVLMDADEWERAGAVFAGFLAPTVVRKVGEGTTPFDVPDEAYGIAVMIGSSYAPMYQGELALGGGVYTVDKLAERAELKQTVTELGA
jgi:hypothetical protein